MGKQTGKVSFKTPLQPAATAAAEPAWAKFLKACGFKQTAFTTTGISWVPHADCTHIPLTVECAEINHAASPGQLITLLGGVMGSVSIQIGELGEPVWLMFDMQGSLESITDRVFGSMLDPTTLTAIQPPSSLGMTLSAMSLQHNYISKFAIDIKNAIHDWGDASEGSGVRGAYLGSKEVTMTVDPIAELLATDPIYTSLKAGTVGTLSLALNCTPALTISAPVIQYSSKTRGEREEAATAEKVFRLHKSAGNDCLEILQGAKA
jgi:hypothetical protein